MMDHDSVIVVGSTDIRLLYFDIYGNIVDDAILSQARLPKREENIIGWSSSEDINETVFFFEVKTRSLICVDVYRVGVYRVDGVIDAFEKLQEYGLVGEIFNKTLAHLCPGGDKEGRWVYAKEHK